jgi:8-oxo-dGTP diphosphatase
VSPAQRTRVAAYALTTDEGGRVLLCRIAPSVMPGQRWTLPGGGVDFGESPARAVIRELAEETGLAGEVVALADVSDRMLTPADGDAELHAIRIMYRVRITGGELRDEPDGSTDTCAWIDPAAARRLNLGELARRALSMLRADRDLGA